MITKGGWAAVAGALVLMLATLAYAADPIGVLTEIRAGTVDRSWVDKALKEKGYKV